MEGAEPGDCLVVDILDSMFSSSKCRGVILTTIMQSVKPFDKMPWGYTGIFELENGGGLFGEFIEFFQ